MRKTIYQKAALMAIFVAFLVAGLVSCSDDVSETSKINNQEEEAFGNLALELESVSNEFFANRQPQSVESGRGVLDFFKTLLGRVVVDASSTIRVYKVCHDFRYAIAVGSYTSSDSGPWFPCYPYPNPFFWSNVTSRDSVDFKANEIVKFKLDSLLAHNVSIIDDVKGDMERCLGNWHNAIIISSLKNYALLTGSAEDDAECIILGCRNVNSKLRTQSQVVIDLKKEDILSQSNLFQSLYMDDSDGDYLKILDKLAASDDSFGQEMALMRDYYYIDLEMLQTIEEVKNLSSKFKIKIGESDISEDSKRSLLAQISVAENSYELWHTMLYRTNRN